MILTVRIRTDEAIKRMVNGKNGWKSEIFQKTQKTHFNTCYFLFPQERRLRENKEDAALLLK